MRALGRAFLSGTERGSRRRLRPPCPRGRYVAVDLLTPQPRCQVQRRGGLRLMSLILFAYFGPETMLPLTSVVATVVGIFMMFGRTSLRLVRRSIVSLLPAKSAKRPVPKPHFHVEAETLSASEANRP